MISDLPQVFKPKIVLNRARCELCKDVIVSAHRHDYRTCRCGYLAVDGGRAYLRRACDERMVKREVDAFRTFTELSIHTSIVTRRGLVLHAYQPADRVIYCTDIAGNQTAAEPPTDWVVYEAEGGSTAWSDALFREHHIIVKEPESD